MDYNNSPSNDEIASAIRKKRAQKAAEAAFNTPSEFAGISKGELAMIIDDAERAELNKPKEPEIKDLSPEQIKRMQKAFLDRDYSEMERAQHEED